MVTSAPIGAMEGQLKSGCSTWKLSASFFLVSVKKRTSFFLIQLKNVVFRFRKIIAPKAMTRQRAENIQHAPRTSIVNT